VALKGFRGRPRLVERPNQIAAKKSQESGQGFVCNKLKYSQWRNGTGPITPGDILAGDSCLKLDWDTRLLTSLKQHWGGLGTSEVAF